MRRSRFGWVVSVILLLALLIVVFVYLGLYDVSANRRDSALVRRTMRIITVRSVRHHAAGIKTPALDDPKIVSMGFDHYSRMCVFCHGAPGIQPRELGKSLNPRPPKLVETARHWKPNELFWITKNGVRMTGMPAWGTTHSDDEIWAMVAFMQKLRGLTPEEYKKMARQAGPMDM